VSYLNFQFPLKLSEPVMPTPRKPKEVPDPTQDRLREAVLLAADAVGDVMEYWGFRKALGRTWTVLYLHGEPMSAAELCKQLQVSSGAMSMTLTELQRWGVAKRVWRPGERREYYEAETSLWKMIARVIDERERHLAVSVKERLQQAVDLLRELPERNGSLDRVKRLLALATLAETMIEGVLSSRIADFSGLANLALGVVRAGNDRRR
jgi:DNA-binding transcriptional regulator GbsR (MarR family)